MAPLPPGPGELLLLRPRSRLATPLLLLLVPATLGCLVAFPILCLFSIVPILGFFSLPTLISVTLFLLYSITWILYLLLAQTDPPTNVYLPFLPLSPFRSFKVTFYAFRLFRDLVASSAISLFLDSQFRRVMILGGKDAKTILKENVLYAEGGRRLDVYLPVRAEGEREELAPVIVFVGGGNWSWWRKSAGAQTALRLRRLGFAVVVPDLTQWPRGKTPEMVSDLRHVLEWTGERIQTYGGDPDQIHVLGYGSGAHLSLLTVVQDAVVRSRDEALSSPAKGPELDISAGIRRCQIWGEEARLPPIAGLILVSGVFDLIKQLRFEAKLGIEDISALRRSCGPSTGATLLSCPSHLLFGAKEILDPNCLPPKILIIAGGKDLDVPYAQSVLLRSLLVGVGVGVVRLKLYRDETHLGSLASLMHQTRYSPLILSEIESIVEAEC